MPVWHTLLIFLKSLYLSLGVFKFLWNQCLSEVDPSVCVCVCVSVCVSPQLKFPRERKSSVLK